MQRTLCFVTFTAALAAWPQQVPSIIQVARVDYAAGTLIGSRVISTEPGSNHSPLWSPNGQVVAYVSEQQDTDKRVLVVRSPDTGAVIRSINLPLGSFFPLVWSGGSLYGGGWTATSGGGIYRVDAETGDSALVYKGAGHIRVSKDGTKLYFGRALKNGAEMALIEREIAEGKEREVMRRQWFQGMALSQDNQYLVTAGIDPATNSRTTLLVAVASGEVREIQRVASDLSPSALTEWSRGTKFWHSEWRSGSQSFLTLKRLADESQEDEVWESPLHGTPRKLAFRLPRAILTYRLQPDGSRITWATRTPSPETKR